MAFNRPVRRWVCICALGLGFGLGMSACSAPPPPRHVEVSPVRHVTAPPQVAALAATFVDQFIAGQYAEQWSELAPQAQAMWPSESARTAMLAAKFTHARVQSITVGEPSLDPTWTAPEEPAVQMDDVWDLPLEVTFAAPQALRPVGVAALFSMTRFQIMMEKPAGIAAILDEGPASMDAPVVLPSVIPSVSVDVPILMYHLIDQIPPRSIEPSARGWQLEVGLTTLPSALNSQMAYLTSIHATSISLQHLADSLLYRLPLPPHPVVITFDDGRLSQWINAVPVLRRDDFTAVFFPCTGLIGKTVGPQTYMTASEIQDLVSSGFASGATRSTTTPTSSHRAAVC